MQWLGNEDDQDIVIGHYSTHTTSLFSSEVENVWSYTSIPPHVIVEWFLIKHKDKFSLSSSIYA
jgi:hypothetical protein